jgi:hypothetical protein
MLYELYLEDKSPRTILNSEKKLLREKSSISAATGLV